MSKLYFRYGVMGSSKSTVLLTQAHSFEERSIPFLCIKSSIDNRDGEEIIKSRVGIERSCISVTTEDNLYLIITRFVSECTMRDMPKPMWILVDESQFLTTEQVNQLADIVDDLDINVCCYGLRTDFATHFFDGSKRLMELSDDIEELKISCSCGRKAIINARLDDDGIVINEGEQVLIGGNERYVPLCRKCYKNRLKLNM